MALEPERGLRLTSSTVRPLVMPHARPTIGRSSCWTTAWLRLASRQPRRRWPLVMLNELRQSTTAELRGALEAKSDADNFPRRLGWHVAGGGDGDGLAGRHVGGRRANRAGAAQLPRQPVRREATDISGSGPSTCHSSPF